ncbi:MAG: class I SAM-dependent methyltransferase [Bifidobacterium tibiigranuli]|jgi:2-polyprenyl-3-methyl-5-hydroxy-6-metoxy-1,4-benzoquinol methylase|nr:class I SAM-dependent methyltransferase [Bifidobacterium tibiigranuli]MCI1797697.1 class I SAM-dependent methyltransferase [Bifidobacterium tibiigranuli]
MTFTEQQCDGSVTAARESRSSPAQSAPIQKASEPAKRRGAARPSAPTFWNDFYANNTWSHEHGTVGRHLVTEVAHLNPGTALDLGCGEGSDAIWLAQQGWHVLAVDAAETALDRAREHAAALGLDHSIQFAQCDLAVDFPRGQYDLVSAQYLHSPVAQPGERERILHRATQAVAPNGHLLVVSHWTVPSWHPKMPNASQAAHLTLPSPQENRAALQLADDQWEILRDELADFEQIGPEGQREIRQDHVLHVRRLS